jgi:hypothetical protein
MESLLVCYDTLSAHGCQLTNIPLTIWPPSLAFTQISQFAGLDRLLLRARAAYYKDGFTKLYTKLMLYLNCPDNRPV